MFSLSAVFAAIRDAFWGTPMLILLLACGLALALRTRFVQLRYLNRALGLALGQRGRGGAGGRPGELSPFQALTAALAATVGTGNIAGVSAALTLGGPGALLWMWVAALLGMGVKYAEVLLAVHTRKRGEDGAWRGGSMEYMRSLGRPGKALAAAFCLFGVLASLGMGSAVQAGTMGETVYAAIRGFLPAFAWRVAVGWAVGLLCAASAGLTLMGGVKRLGRVTEKLVPAMAGLYIAACLGVLCLRRENLLPALGSVFAGAFRPRAVTGGAVGGLLAAASAGARCGVFSNEAGLGSAPMAYAASGLEDPGEAGLYGVFEVFADTLVICTLTGLSLLASGIPLPWGEAGTAALNARALGSVYGSRLGPAFLALCAALFSLGTILSWSFYGLRCWETLFRGRGLTLYRCLYVLACLGGALLRTDTLWSLAETANGLMCLPNLTALLILSPRVGELSREGERKFRRGMEMPRYGCYNCSNK